MFELGAEGPVGGEMRAGEVGRSQPGSARWPYKERWL